jgi:hypothetical protein
MTRPTTCCLCVLSILSVCVTGPVVAQQPRTKDGGLAAVRALIRSDSRLNNTVETADTSTLRRDFVRCGADGKSCTIAENKSVLMIETTRFDHDTLVAILHLRGTAKNVADSGHHIGTASVTWTLVYRDGTWSRVKERSVIG